jgi:tetratricopeptide (TPR) repeat protein
LLVKGRMLLAEGKASEAVAALKQAVAINPLPEYQWTLTEAWRAAGNNDEAVKVEAELLAKGAQEDSRTLSLYLATNNKQAEKALKLAQQELAHRADSFTYDALAWALQVTGQTTEAQAAMQQALAAGTNDARLFYHAGVIAARAGNKKQAQHYFKQAYSSRQMLLPSEREGLMKEMSAA